MITFNLGQTILISSFLVSVDNQGAQPQIPTILYEWFYSQFIATRHETVQQNLISD